LTKKVRGELLNQKRKRGQKKKGAVLQGLQG
jgi:hypothetical protein